MPPDQIIARVAEQCGPVTEWNLADPAALVEAWREVLSDSCVMPVQPTAEDMDWARKMHALDAVKCELIRERDEAIKRAEAAWAQTTQVTNQCEDAERERDTLRARADRLEKALRALIDANTSPSKGLATNLYEIIDAVEAARAALAQEQA